MDEEDPFFQHYFRRIDPAVARSFSEEQRRALKTMFGARGISRHAIDLRRSLGIGRARFYFVLLCGRERRDAQRRRRDGVVSRGLNLLAGALVVLVALTPFLIGLYALKSALGIDIFAYDGVHGLMARLGDQVAQIVGAAR